LTWSIPPIVTPSINFGSVIPRPSERPICALLPSTLYKSELTQTPTDRFRIGYGRENLDEGLAVLEANLH
jgi:hypothetical protein